MIVVIKGKIISLEKREKDCDYITILDPIVMSDRPVDLVYQEEENGILMYVLN